jgi:hypothetical protein
MRILSCRPVFVHRPFQGQGASVYAGIGQPRYRKPRMMPDRPIPLEMAFTSDKTARIASEAGTGELAIDATLSDELIDNPNVAIDVRHYRDDVENDSCRPQLVSVDSSGDGEDVISGRAILILPVELRDGGGIRIHFRYEHDRGTPARFRLTCLSGPTSPDDVEVTYTVPGRYEADVAAVDVSDGDYEFELSIEDDPGDVTLTLLPLIEVTVETSGPDAPTILTAEVR